VGVGQFLKAGNATGMIRSIMILSVHRNVPREFHTSTPFIPNLAKDAILNLMDEEK
jgi:hypothetical protein